MPLARLLARAATVERLGWGRTAVGGVMLARPTALPRLMGLDSATAARTGWAVQMLGAREVALGLGAVAAVRSGDARALRLLVLGGLLSDAVDALAVGRVTASGTVSRPAGAAVVAAATAATAVQVEALRSGAA